MPSLTGADVDTASATQAVLLTVKLDFATVARGDRADALREERLEWVWAVGARAVESERDAIVRSCRDHRHLTGVLELRVDGDVETSDEGLGVDWVDAELGQAGGKIGESIGGADVGGL